MTPEFFMQQAIKEAKKAYKQDEVPVGAVAVKDGVVIARAFNKKEKKQNATAHAEMELIAKTSALLKNWYLEGVDIYVTLEPCAMCIGAMVNARIKNLYFGAYDKRFGCCGSVLDISKPLNHKIQCTGGILEKECGQLLSLFFGEKRKKQKENL